MAAPAYSAPPGTEKATPAASRTSEGRLWAARRARRSREYSRRSPAAAESSTKAREEIQNHQSAPRFTPVETSKVLRGGHEKGRARRPGRDLAVYAALRH